MEMTGYYLLSELLRLAPYLVLTLLFVYTRAHKVGMAV